MKLKQELEEIKNKDLSKMTNDELLKYKQELFKKLSSVKSTNKVSLKKALYIGVSYICGAGIGYCAARVLMTYIYTGSLSVLLPNLKLALLCGIPITCTYILYKIANSNVKKLTQLYNDKLLEVDRQIAVNDFKKELELSKNTQDSSAQAV